MQRVSSTLSKRLIIAQFVRTLTTDNAEAVQTAQETVFTGKRYEEIVEEIYEINVGRKSKAEDVEAFKLILGGDSRSYCFNNRYYCQRRRGIST